MSQLSAVLWMVLGSAFSIMGVAAVFASPSLMADAATLAPITCLIAFALALPVSAAVSRRISEQI